MSKNNENKLVPVYRFPEFKDVWKTEQLSNLLDYERPDNYIVKDTNYISEGTPVLTANKSFILGYTQETFGICTTIPAIIFDDFTVDKKFVDFPFKVKSSAIKILRPKGKDDLKFIFELMSLIRFEAKEHKRYYISAYQNLTVPIPKPNEQQKIASCLSSLDDLITAEGKKLEVLKEHKKGLLQNLFPQEGETVPKLRFKEFEGSGEWVEKLLKDVSAINPKTSNLPDEFVYVDLESVEKGILLQKKVIKKEEAPSRAQRLLTANDIAFQMVRPYQMNNYYFKQNDNYEYVTSTGYAQLRSFESSMFLFQLIHTDRFVSNVLKKCTGSNYPAINSSDLSLITLEIPPSIREQQCIASCLSSLDELIIAQGQKIEALQLHKKGLLQGLFPNLNEGNDG